MADFPGHSKSDMEADDELLRRVRATLAPLPPRDPQAVARVLAAVHGRPVSRWSLRTRWRALRLSLGLAPVSLFGGGTIVVATLASILIVRGPWPRADRGGAGVVAERPGAAPADVRHAAPATAPASPASPALPALVNAAGADDPEAPVPVQFDLDAATATSVALVGDFNDWSGTAAPMQRLPGTGIWTITVPVRPGRHVYAFLIDGTRWVADPRAPKAVDADFGKPGSVLLVHAR